jgi:hypothetical protein
MKPHLLQHCRNVWPLTTETSNDWFNSDEVNFTYLLDSVCSVLQVQHKLDKLVAEDGSVQTASYENRGFRKFFFNPGLFDDPSGDADPVTS